MILHKSSATTPAHLSDNNLSTVLTQGSVGAVMPVNVALLSAVFVVLVKLVGVLLETLVAVLEIAMAIVAFAFAAEEFVV